VFASAGTSVCMRVCVCVGVCVWVCGICASVPRCRRRCCVAVCPVSKQCLSTDVYTYPLLSLFRASLRVPLFSQSRIAAVRAACLRVCVPPHRRVLSRSARARSPVSAGGRTVALHRRGVTSFALLHVQRIVIFTAACLQLSPSLVSAAARCAFVSSGRACCAHENNPLPLYASAHMFHSQRRAFSHTTLAHFPVTNKRHPISHFFTTCLLRFARRFSAGLFLAACPFRRTLLHPQKLFSAGLRASATRRTCQFCHFCDDQSERCVCHPTFTFSLATLFFLATRNRLPTLSLCSSLLFFCSPFRFLQLALSSGMVASRPTQRTLLQRPRA